MTHYVGLDVSMKETKLHVLGEAGNNEPNLVGSAGSRDRRRSAGATAKIAVDEPMLKTNLVIGRKLFLLAVCAVLLCEYLVQGNSAAAWSTALHCIGV